MDTILGTEGQNEEANRFGWPPITTLLSIWCGGGDLNPYALRR
jgi:hypothetical protein